MSIAFYLYCVWILAVVGIRFAPAPRRPLLRFCVLAASILPIGLAAVTVGWIPALIGLCGVFALFPAPMRQLVDHLLALGRARIGAWRAARAG